ncbi:type VI secretion system lipoprotein TssJ [Marinobacter bohaiensis]|uniref:type VI secretion system lipoprotein TssJ n=1 Tax=Marinobacter bohaiensis TaxID=2201898 RepID=UPI000DAD14FF|nr:type VI secretion system lipoprotein TssJ [Marinobacter bohaiensis]
MRIGQWILLCAVLGLAGCSGPFKAISKSAQVMWDPDTPVGTPDEQPTTVDLTMLAEPDVNPNDAMQPAPIMFKIIEMEDSSMMLAADFDQISEDLEDALGANYIDHSDYAMVPGQFKYIESFEVDSGTRYLGVVAFYAFPNESQWKKVVKVDPMGGRYHILVNLREREVMMQKADQ